LDEAGIPGDADNGVADWMPGGVVSEREQLAQGVFAGPEAAREGFAHYNDIVLGGGEIAAEDEGKFESRKEVGAGVSEGRVSDAAGKRR
jgi:hypothetical protein